MTVSAEPLLLAPEDDGHISDPLRKKVEELMSKSDREFLTKLRTQKRIEAGADDDPGELSVLYLQYYGLLEVDMDPGARIFLCATPVLELFFEPPVKRRRRRRKNVEAPVVSRPVRRKAKS